LPLGYPRLSAISAGQQLRKWKGVARYLDVIAGGKTALRAAWAYDRPTPRFAALAGHVAFYAGLMDGVWVGNLRVIPQPGHFYGGWTTPNMDGQIKGALGTRHWYTATHTGYCRRLCTEKM
jgi:hypothetical protein